jgi:hypothetical protein
MIPRVLPICLLMVVMAPASIAQTVCKSIKAVQRDELITSGCTTPLGFCASGTIDGNHGLQGTSFFSGFSFNPIPSDPFGRLAVPGVTTYTTDDGTITISDVSVFDIERGTLAGVGRIVQGTGRFEGAFGDIFTTGRVLSNGTSFITEVTGELCLPK